jgi:fatty-acyl-CoA synthase
MMDFPLTITHIFGRAERYHRAKTLLTVTKKGRDLLTYGEWAERARRLGDVLDRLGLSADARVGTFAWNTARHLELYFAVPCSGRVLHTLNIRLFPEQLTYIVNHAADEAIFVDRSLLPQLAPLLGTFEHVRHLVVMDDGGDADLQVGSTATAVHDYEDLLAEATPTVWPDLAEDRAASMCYTSGTTGNPKGALYSHRSTFLHTFGTMQADSVGVCERDVVLPVVPMFHANAWGLAHAAVAAGSALVMPGPDLSAAALADLIVEEKVTVAAGVPTIWMGVLPLLEGRDTSHIRKIPCGGSAVPRALSEGYRAVTGKPILQAWCMTETSPIASVFLLKSTLEHLSDEAQADLRATVGMINFGVECRIVGDPLAEGRGAAGATGSGDYGAAGATGAGGSGAEDRPVEQPWDGEAQGELQVRGPWVIRSYYDDDRSPQSFSADGWLKTGDVATIDPEGYIRLVDRSKDVIKSGGEWVSSVELENAIMGHPKVAEAAVVGVGHPRWGERPIACVVVKDGEQVTAEEILAYLDGRVAKWWVPDAVVFIDEVPKTSTGKFSKKDLRDRFADFTLPG